MKTEQCCVVEYLYRDASNYKVHFSAVVSGPYSDDAERVIRNALIDGMYFVPERVGLPPLQNELFTLSGGETDDDHPWHELIDFRPALKEDLPASTINMTVRKLVDNFRQISLASSID